MPSVAEFARSRIRWADGILDKPSYIMPNGRNSHDVAIEVKNDELDKALEGDYLGVHWDGKKWVLDFCENSEENY